LVKGESDLQEEILSQNEINALLDAVTQGEVNVEQSVDEAEDIQIPKEYKAYDFKQRKVSKDLEKTMHMLHNHFARQFSSSLSSLLRMLTEVECSAVDQMAYADYLMSLSEPSCLSILSMEPLQGNAVMEVSPNIVFPTIERLLGGPGSPMAQGNTMARNRELSKLEENMIENTLIEKILDTLQEVWANVVEDITITMEQLEKEPQYVQVVSSTDTVMVVMFQVGFGQVSGLMSLCFPTTMVEPVLGNMASEQTFFDKNADNKDKVLLESYLRRTDVTIRALLPATPVSIKKLLTLQREDSLMLSMTAKDIKDKIIVEVKGKPKYYGQLGRIGKKKAVRITGIIKEDE